MNLRGVDLNLFVVFEALMAEGGVTRAARRLGVSQPAVSEALGRLRQLMGDELFVRTPRGMVPTARAVAAADTVREALAALQQAAQAGAPFDPARAGETFRICADGYAEMVVLPALVSRLRVQAPGMNLRMVAADSRAAIGLLDAGEAELAIDAFDRGLPKRFDRIELLRERAVCLSRKGHPTLAQGGLTLGAYVELPHVAGSITGSVNRAVVDRALAAIGKRRRVALTVTNYLVLLAVLSETELIATQPERIARRLAALGGLDLHEPPLALPSWSVDLVWGRGAARDPAAAWLRGLICEVCRDL
jgi:DNA-binding transcriptional LysR family regulator